MTATNTRRWNVAGALILIAMTNYMSFSIGKSARWYIYFDPIAPRRSMARHLPYGVEGNVIEDVKVGSGQPSDGELDNDAAGVGSAGAPSEEVKEESPSLRGADTSNIAVDDGTKQKEHDDGRETEQTSEQPAESPAVGENTASKVVVEEGAPSADAAIATDENDSAKTKQQPEDKQPPIGPLNKPKFTKPSPHLWTSIHIVPPHTGHKKVLVTGAAGFIASHVADFLLKRGDEVIVVDEVNDYYDVRIKEGNLNLLRKTADEMAEKDGNKKGKDILSIYRGDINNQTLMMNIFETHKPQWICHLAARAGVRPSIQDPLLYVKANVQGTTNMLEYSRQFNVTNVVVASSSSVYGESESTYFSEGEIVDEPVSPYAATKRSGEIMSYTYHKMYHIPITNLRFFTVYGPRGRPDMAPYKFITRVTRGEQIDKYGDGTTSRDYTFIDDIVDGVVRAIDRPYGYQIINLGKGAGTTLNEFISLVEKHVGKKANINQMPAQLGDVPFTNADVSKAYRLLGYSSKTTFEEGIEKTVAWHKETYGEDGMKEVDR